MANFIPLIVVLAVICFDLSILRKQDQTLFRKIFSFPLWLAIIYPLLGVALAVAGRHAEYFNAFFFLFIFPIYLLRRRRFRKALCSSDQGSEYVIAMPSRLTLVSDAIGLLWVWLWGMAGIIIGLQIIDSFDPRWISELGPFLFISFSSSL